MSDIITKPGPHRWQKGECGNPTGKGRGTKSAAMLRKAEHKAITLLMQEADNGNVEAASALLQYMKRNIMH